MLHSRWLVYAQLTWLKVYLAPELEKVLSRNNFWYDTSIVPVNTKDNHKSAKKKKKKKKKKTWNKNTVSKFWPTNTDFRFAKTVTVHDFFFLFFFF